MELHWSTGMLSGIKKFSDCQSGSIAVFAALLILPMMGFMACLYEYSEFTKIHDDIQKAADNAVLAAFHNPREEWADREQRTNAIFEANLAHKLKMKFAKARLSHKAVGKKTVLTYRVRTGIKTVLAAFLPNMPEEFTITARASFDPKSRIAPRLLEIDYSQAGSTSSQVKRPDKKRSAFNSERTASQ